MHLGWLAVDQFVAAVRGRPTLTWLGWLGESVALVRVAPRPAQAELAGQLRLDVPFACVAGEPALRPPTGSGCPRTALTVASLWSRLSSRSVIPANAGISSRSLDGPK